MRNRARQSLRDADVPLIGDAVPGYAVTGQLGIGAPKSTAAEIVERLNRESTRRSLILR